LPAGWLPPCTEFSKIQADAEATAFKLSVKQTVVFLKGIIRIFMANVFEAEPIEGGYSWTITSKLSNIINVAETRFGKRDYSYTILGIELTHDPIPKIWYPGNRKHIIIQITKDCLNNMDKAVFQTAHEVIHCLSPNRESRTNVLEEGLATLFAIQYINENNHEKFHAEEPEYINAYNLANSFLSIDPDIIKKLREVEPTISLISKDMILDINPAIQEDLIEKLLEPFQYVIR
jgi:hypothetical protein